MIIRTSWQANTVSIPGLWQFPLEEKAEEISQNRQMSILRYAHIVILTFVIIAILPFFRLG
jgi:hypothetical protein